MTEDERARVDTILESGQLADGPEVRSFESEFADYCSVEYGVATSNGTTALHAALEALDLGDGDRVLTTPFSFIATANAIRLCGATPVFADIDPHTYNLDPDSVEARLRDGDEIDAVVVVHLYGLPAEMDRFRELAAEYDFHLVEDAAQAHGAEYDGVRVGSLSDVACFSFYPTKNMTTGEGGMIVTDDDEVAARAAQYINHGRESSGYTHTTVGHNFRMTSIAAAIGRVQLKQLSGFVESRRQNALQLNRYLADTSVTTPIEPANCRHAYHQYTVRTDDREQLQAALNERGIGCGVYYPTPIHRQPAYAGIDYDAPIAEQAADEVLSLPVHPELTPAQLREIGDAVCDYAEVVSSV